jgi:hypothetical protein
VNLGKFFYLSEPESLELRQHLFYGVFVRNTRGLDAFSIILTQKLLAHPGNKAVNASKEE